MSHADNLFIDTCLDIVDNGYSTEGQKIRPKWPDDGSPAHTFKKFGIVNRYDLQKEFPILTVRPVPLQSCIKEILWIWQKKSNRIEDLGLRIWDAWADENGTIGKAYGYQLGKKSKYPDGEFDQVDRVLKDLKETPQSRRIITNMFNHQELHEMQLQPCAYECIFNVVGNTLNMILNQRSNDMVVAGGWNVTQYAILLHMFAQVSGLQAGELVHVIADAHVYDRHVPILRELATRERFNAPRLVMNKEITDFYKFTVDDFKLENYTPNEQIKNIPVAV